MGSAKPMVYRDPFVHLFCGHAVCLVGENVILLSPDAKHYHCKRGSDRKRSGITVLVLR